jgi:hypothetical protein
MGSTTIAVVLVVATLAAGLAGCATHGQVVAAPEECARAGGAWRSTSTCEHPSGGGSGM